MQVKTQNAEAQQRHHVRRPERPFSSTPLDGATPADARVPVQTVPGEPQADWGQFNLLEWDPQQSPEPWPAARPMATAARLPGETVASRASSARPKGPRHPLLPPASPTLQPPAVAHVARDSSQTALLAPGPPPAAVASPSVAPASLVYNCPPRLPLSSLTSRSPHAPSVPTRHCHAHSLALACHLRRLSSLPRRPPPNTCPVTAR